MNFTNKTPEEETKETPEVVETPTVNIGGIDYPAQDTKVFNCAACQGQGLKSQTELCPVCKGTGKV